jgi:nicotinate phosphoribosyltransferase
VGTQLSVSADAPTLSTVYKLVELEISGIKRFTAKFSDEKPSYPGSKQIFRDTARDVIARSGECGRGEALLRPILLGGRLLEPLPTIEQARQRAAESIAKLPDSLRQLDQAEPWPVIYSRELRELIERTRRNILG